jgi:glycosyltransferase involved in cell wall biosynthesis
VIPTRNRGAEAAEAAKAVLRDNSNFELLVVDQSTNEATADALRTRISDSRLRVVRSPLLGISNARNTGVAATSCPIIAFTDDDCRPEADWPSALLRVFAEEPDASLVFGRVHLPPGASRNGYATSFEPVHRILDGGIPTPDAVGVGANFAVRRHVLERLGGFDPLLGVGAPFFSGGEEVDLVLRSLRAGYRVVNATECDVLHLGVRWGAEIRPLVVAYQIATGAAMAKHARVAGLLGLRDLWRWTTFYAREITTNAARLRRLNLGVPCYFVAGALLTLRYRIDAECGIFRTRSLPMESEARSSA